MTIVGVVLLILQRRKIKGFFFENRWENNPIEQIAAALIPLHNSLSDIPVSLWILTPLSCSFLTHADHLSPWKLSRPLRLHQQPHPLSLPSEYRLIINIVHLFQKSPMNPYLSTGIYGVFNFLSQANRSSIVTTDCSSCEYEFSTTP